MNPIGANTWIWVSPPTDERLAELAPRIRGWGFDVIEIPIEQPGDWDPGRTAELLADLGLGATTCAVMPDSRSLVSDDRSTVEATRRHTCARAWTTPRESVRRWWVGRSTRPWAGRRS